MNDKPITKNDLNKKLHILVSQIKRKITRREHKYMIEVRPRYIQLEIDYLTNQLEQTYLEMDLNFYPSYKTLTQIRKCNNDDTMIDILFDNWIWKQLIELNNDGHIIYLELHTGNWKGHIKIIKTLKQTKFWDYLVAEERGGHYWFEINTKIIEGQEIK